MLNFDRTLKICQAAETTRPTYADLEFVRARRRGVK